MLYRSFVLAVILFCSPLLAASKEPPMTDAAFDFAVRLHQLHAAAGNDAPNLVFSPLSIHMALSMTSLGAAGQTLTEMRKSLALDTFAKPDDAHMAYEKLATQLLDHPAPLSPDDAPAFEFTLSNHLWVQAGYPINPTFSKLIRVRYRGDIDPLDFAAAPDAARVKINDVIAKQTSDKIKDLMAPGTVDALTRLVLTNAVYLKAAWEDPFRTSNTTPNNFHLLDGSVKKDVPLMSTVLKLQYFENDQLKFVELPYVGANLSMLLVLSKSADVGSSLAIEKQLADLPKWATQASQYQVTLKLPKFKIETSLGLADDLKKLGMPDAFSDHADFTGITTHDPLQIGDVVHKAFIDVDEAGTEAAAATAVVMRVGAAPYRPQMKTAEFIVDRPFLFAIRHNQTGTILFLGRVTKP